MKRALSIPGAALLAALGSMPAQQTVPTTPRAWHATLAEADGTDLFIQMTVVMQEAGRWEIYSRPGGA